MTRSLGALPSFQPPDARRSATMRAVRGFGTKLEQTVAAAVAKLRPRRADVTLPGKPDFVFPKAHVVVFVNGCFWHDHGCPRGARLPKRNRSYWRAKIGRNSRRDRRVARDLRASGWSVMTIWECDVKGGIRRLLQRLQR